MVERGRYGVRTEGAANGSVGAAGEVEEGWPALAGAEVMGPGAPVGIEGAGSAGEGLMQQQVKEVTMEVTRELHSVLARSSWAL